MGNLTGFVPLSLSFFLKQAVCRATGVVQEAIESVRQITRDLFHPSFARLGRNSGNLDHSCLQAHHEKNVVAYDPCKCENLDGEEVQCERGVPIGFKKRSSMVYGSLVPVRVRYHGHLRMRFTVFRSTVI